MATAARTFNDCPNGFCDFGRNVAGGHDINGDGFSDVLMAAYRFDGDRGTAFVHLGNGGRGSPLAPLQALGFGGAPRALRGITPNALDASLLLHSPAGRTNVQLEIEAKLLGQDFDGDDWIDVAVAKFDQDWDFDIAVAGNHEFRGKSRVMPCIQTDPDYGL